MTTTDDPRLQAILNNLPEFVHATLNLPALVSEIEADRFSIQPAPLPRLYQVETTSRCNLKCPFCPRTTDLLPHGQRDLNSVMPLREFEGLLDRLPWVKSLELFHFGEPFM